MTPLLLGTDFAVLRPLWVPVALALALLAFVLRDVRHADGWRRVLSPEVFAFLRGTDDVDPSTASRERKPVPGFDPALLAAAVVALALAAPATRQGDAAAWRHASGWIAVADVSRSMTLDDTVPSRLAALRETLLALSERAGARPLALILYAGDAFLVAPPAFDRRLLAEHAALLEYGVVPLDGSNLARALSLAADVASGSAFVGARVFVLGDSGGAGRASAAAARHLADGGHRVDLVLFGGDEGRLPVDVGASERVARAGGGRLVRSDTFGRVPLDVLALERDADPLRTRGLESLLWRDRSHWLLLGAIPLMLAAFRRVGA